VGVILKIRGLMMTHVRIEGHGLSLTSAIEKHALDKINKLEKFFSNITNIHVILKHEHNDYIAEAELHVPGVNNNLFASAKNNDLYKSVDLLEKKLEILVKKHHDKVKHL
jgi:putative sigma-54 modulation protein